MKEMSNGSNGLAGNGLAGAGKGGVILGGRSITLTLSRDDYSILTVLAKMNSTGQTQMCEFIVSQGLQSGWSQVMMGKLLFLLATWATWATWR